MKLFLSSVKLCIGGLRQVAVASAMCVAFPLFLPPCLSDVLRNYELRVMHEAVCLIVLHGNAEANNRKYRWYIVQYNVRVTSFSSVLTGTC